MSNISNYTCSELRENARDLLTGKWNDIVICTLIYFVITGSFGLVTKIFGPFAGIFIFVIQGPMMLGYSGICLKIMRNEKFEIGDLFKGFDNFTNALVLQLLIILYTFLWSLLFFIPGIIASLSYSQSFFILYDNPEISPQDAIAHSKTIMKGNKGKLFILYLSFIGWSILCFFTFGIGSLWLIPYINVTIAVFYKIITNSGDNFYKDYPAK